MTAKPNQPMHDDMPAPARTQTGHATPPAGGGWRTSARRLGGVCLSLALLLGSSLAIARHNRSDAFVPISLLWFAACVLVVLKSRSRLRRWALSAGVVVFAFGVVEAYLAGWLPGQHRLHLVEPLGQLHELHPILGYTARKNARVIVRKYHGREVVFDVQYTTDANGLRAGPPRADAASSSVLFLGDSLTFGWGVNDHETMPYRFEELSRGRFKSFNFAFSGYGPHHMLAILENGLERKTVESQPPRFAVYQAIPEHIDRCAGHMAWNPGGPRYVLDAQRQPRYTGPFHNAFLRNFWTLTGRSQAMIRLMQAAWRRTPQDTDLFLAVVQRSEALFRERYGGQFHILLWDRGDPDYAGILSKMRERKLAVIEIKDALPGYPEAREPYRIPHDSHPNKLAHEKIAEHLLKVLR